jgi:D-inositol-3-phosphate glycosyltransferase
VLPQALNAADLLVLPSVAEAFGLVLVEAMSCGLRVIAAEAHGRAEIVAAGTGWLVLPDDEGALADALVTAASDAEERRRRGARAYRHIHTHYGWPVIAARIAALYAELLAASPRAARA